MKKANMCCFFFNLLQLNIILINKNEKKPKTTLSEQFQKPIEKSPNEAKSVPLTHKYMTAHFPGFAQALQ